MAEGAPAPHDKRVIRTRERVLTGTYRLLLGGVRFSNAPRPLRRNRPEFVGIDGWLNSAFTPPSFGREVSTGAGSGNRMLRPDLPDR